MKLLMTKSNKKYRKVCRWMKSMLENEKLDGNIGEKYHKMN